MPMSAAAHRQLNVFPSLIRSPLGTAMAVALFSFAVCYFRSFIFPHVPVVMWRDQLGFFNSGSRMALGQLPYRDYLQIVPPGIDLVYALLIKAFGVRIWIPNLVMACLAAVVAFEMTLIASHLMRGAILALPGLLFAGFILWDSTDATHHWFSTVATLAATLVLLNGTTLRHIAAAGGLCGVGSCFTQSTGAMAVAGLLAYLAYYLWRRRAPAVERWQKCLLLCGTAATVFAAFNVFFIRAAGISRWLFCLIVYPLRYYRAPSINNWGVVMYEFHSHPGITRWVRFPFVWATVPVAVIALVLALRHRRSDEQDERWQKVALVAITGIAMFLAVASAPSVKRLGMASPPALVLLAWLLRHPGGVSAGLRTLLGCGAFVLAIAVPARLQLRAHPTLDLPGGRAGILDPAIYDEYRWLRGATHPGEYFFGMAPMYSGLHLRNPAAIESVHDSEYTRPEQVTALIDALESHRVQILVVTPMYDPFHKASSPHDHLDPLRAYIKRNYRPTKSFQTNHVAWERIETPAPAAESTRPAP